MNKPLLLFGMYILVAIGLDARAVPRLNPPVPPIGSFANCKNIEVPDFESFVRCMEPGGQIVYQYFGKPVDGNPRLRHLGWTLEKMQIKDVDSTLFLIQQAAFDCASGGGVEREAYSFIRRSDLSQKLLPVELQTWKPIEGNYSKIAEQWCPPKDGYVRINQGQYAINSAIRRGSRVNVNAIGKNGFEYVFVVECSTMMYGVNKQPDKPISPKSVGYEIYKRVCK
jgi:hypothetical protein